MGFLDRLLFSTGISILCCGSCYSGWAKISNVEVKQEATELAGPRVVIEYDMNELGVSADQPVYVFVRYRADSTSAWRLIPPECLKGNGYDLVEGSGPKKIIWWGTGETSFKDMGQVEFRVRGIRMCEVVAGGFVMKSIPAGGRDESKSTNVDPNLALFYIAKYETTVSMYADYLNEIGGAGTGWYERMANMDRCGIVSVADGSYSIIPEREQYPITYVSWYDAVGFLNWCGLRLPTEPEWEKALRGGIYLDGDEPKDKPNPLPDRRYPWGNESPDANGVYRCNYDGADDGFEYTAPVGSFDKFNSPYGVCDLAGNVAEWTLDWYSTPYHVGLDGFRMVRGGSWMAVPAACDAVTGATQFPIKQSSIIGFRGVR